MPLPPAIFHVLLAVIWLHFFGDFVLQSDKMAINKSSSWLWLFAHAVVYSCPLFLIGWKFALLNAAAHFAVDAVTSRITSKLWALNMRHWFFVCIGFDQAIHFTILFWALKLK